MSYTEFRSLIGRAHLTMSGFAQLLRMNRISLSNYAKKGRVPSHLAVIATLLREMSERGIDFRPVLEEIHLAPKKPRGAGIGKFGGDRQSRLF